MYRPATAAWQDVCTTDQMAGFYAACIAAGPDAGASTVSCKAFSETSSGNAACAACILTPETMTAFGPLVDYGTFIADNVGGCIELTDPNGLVCAKAQQALAGCELAACQANCPVHDNASRDSLDQCTTAAAAAGCQMFATQAGCATTLAEAGTSTACATSFHDFYSAVVPLFCGPPPAIDGGAPRDASPSDAAREADAMLDGPSPDASPRDGSVSDGPLGETSIGDAAADAAFE